jgi:hypothetical protein
VPKNECLTGVGLTPHAVSSLLFPNCFWTVGHPKTELRTSSREGFINTHIAVTDDLFENFQVSVSRTDFL